MCMLKPGRMLHPCVNCYDRRCACVCISGVQAAPEPEMHAGPVADGGAEHAVERSSVTVTDLYPEPAPPAAEKGWEAVPDHVLQSGSQTSTGARNGAEEEAADAASGRSAVSETVSDAASASRSQVCAVREEEDSGSPVQRTSSSAPASAMLTTRQAPPPPDAVFGGFDVDDGGQLSLVPGAAALVRQPDGAWGLVYLAGDTLTPTQKRELQAVVEAALTPLGLTTYNVRRRKGGFGCCHGCR